MDKPHHPIVIQPWKIRRTERTERNVQVKMGTEHGQLVSKVPKIVTSKKNREQGSKKKSEIGP